MNKTFLLLHILVLVGSITYARYPKEGLSKYIKNSRTQVNTETSEEISVKESSDAKYRYTVTNRISGEVYLATHKNGHIAVISKKTNLIIYNLLQKDNQLRVHDPKQLLFRIKRVDDYKYGVYDRLDQKLFHVKYKKGDVRYYEASSSDYEDLDIRYPLPAAITYLPTEDKTLKKLLFHLDDYLFQF